MFHNFHHLKRVLCYICSSQRWEITNFYCETQKTVNTRDIYGMLLWKWRKDRRSERNLCNCEKKSQKNSGLQQGLNPWPRDTGAMLYQLSYEATDVGSRSIVGSYVPVKKMSVNDIWNKSYMNCGNEMKVKKRSSQWTQFMQLRKEVWKKKFRASTGFEPVNSRYRCDALPTFLLELSRIDGYRVFPPKWRWFTRENEHYSVLRKSQPRSRHRHHLRI